MILELKPILNIPEAELVIRCTLFEDNKGAEELANVPKNRPRTKHIAVKYHHFREAVKVKILMVKRVDITDQLADIFTNLSLTAPCVVSVTQSPTTPHVEATVSPLSAATCHAPVLSHIARSWCERTATPSPSPPHSIGKAASVASASLQSNPNVEAFIKSLQREIFQASLSDTHPTSALLNEYATARFPVDAGETWPLASIQAGIALGPHTSTQQSAATTFCRAEIPERITHGFSIILSEEDILLYFDRKLKISCLASVDQANQKPRLICNSSSAPDDITASVDDTTNMQANPQAIQFGACLARVLQIIWEVHPLDGPVLLSKWDVSDAFHQCPLRLRDVGTLSYVVPPCIGYRGLHLHQPCRPDGMGRLPRPLLLHIGNRYRHGQHLPS